MHPTQIFPAIRGRQVAAGLTIGVAVSLAALAAYSSSDATTP